MLKSDHYQSSNEWVTTGTSGWVGVRGEDLRMAQIRLNAATFTLNGLFPENSYSCNKG